MPAGVFKKRQRDSVKNRHLTLLGTMSWVGVGSTCEFKGRWAFHPGFGLQVEVDYVKELRTKSLEVLKRRLQDKLPACGPKTAAAIVAKFQENTEDMLSSPHAVKLLMSIDKIGRTKALAMKEAWDKQMERQGAAMFLQDLGIRRTTAEAAVRVFGANVEAAFRADPHRTLLQLPGFSLKLADSVAQKLGVDPVPRSRGAAGMLQTLIHSAANNGHSFMTWGALQSATARVMDEHALAAAEAEVAQEAQLPAAAAPLDMRDLATCLLELRRLVLEEGDVASGQARVMDQPPPASGHSSDGGAWPWLPLARAYLPQLHEAEKSVAFHLSTLHAGTSSNEGTAAAAGVQAAGSVAAHGMGGHDGGALSTRHASTASSARPPPAAGQPSSGGVAGAGPIHVDPAVHQLLMSIESEGVELTDKQVSAIQMAHNARVMLLTGAAGCGKTFVTRAIVRLWRRQGLRVLMCAPTGRAAQRLQDAVGDPTLEAMTVHRMLKYKRKEDEPSDKGTAATAGVQQQGQEQGADGKGAQVVEDVADDPIGLLDTMAFEHNMKNPVAADAVLVDEASMLDVQLAAVLLRALPSGCRLLLVGDPNQLPPVGPGSVLQDMLNMGGFPRVHLDEIFRQSSGSSIVTGAHAIIAGHSPAQQLQVMSLAQLKERVEGVVLSSSASEDACGNRHTHADAADASGEAEGEDGHGPEVGSPGAEPQWKPRKGCPPSVSALKPALGSDAVLVEVEGGMGAEEVGSQAAEVVRVLKGAGVDVASDLQVLSPSRKTHVGTLELNRVLQPIMNSRGSGRGGQAGSSTQAWHRQQFLVGDRVVQVENNYDHDVYNGDLGTVTRVDERANSTTVVFAARPGGEGPHEVMYKDHARNQLQLAWATTVHKAQGGEYPVVVAPLHESIARSLMQRNMLYTTVTRARHLLVMVATRAALARASSHASAQTRNSLLIARLERSWLDRRLPLPLPPRPAAAAKTPGTPKVARAAPARPSKAAQQPEAAAGEGQVAVGPVKRRRKTGPVQTAPWQGGDAGKARTPSPEAAAAPALEHQPRSNQQQQHVPPATATAPEPLRSDLDMVLVHATAMGGGMAGMVARGYSTSSPECLSPTRGTSLGHGGSAHAGPQRSTVHGSAKSLRPATEKQLKYLRSLGHHVELPMSSQEASDFITCLRSKAI